MTIEGIRQSEAIDWVYRLFDSDGDLLYVGRTQCNQSRINDHRRAAWGKEITRSTVEIWTGHDAALAREKEIIRLENPRHNRNRYPPRGVPVTFIATPDSVKLAAALGVEARELTEGGTP